MSKFPDLSGIRVLVLEDDDSSREVVVEMFTFLGAQVSAHAEPGLALAAVHTAAFDVAVSDIRLGPTSGLDFARQIRRTLPPDRQPRMVAMSAYSDEPLSGVLAAGFDAFVAKMDITELVPVVAGLVGRG